MYYIQSESSFDAAHFLKGYAGKCANLHGHRWRVVATLKGDSLTRSGENRDMLTDFGDLKADLKDLTERFDHAFLVEKGSLMPETLRALEAEGFRMVYLPFRTTAERMAKYFFQQLSARGYSLREVSVYETPTNCAVYDGEEENRHA